MKTKTTTNETCETLYFNNEEEGIEYTLESIEYNFIEIVNRECYLEELNEKLEFLNNESIKIKNTYTTEDISQQKKLKKIEKEIYNKTYKINEVINEVKGRMDYKDHLIKELDRFLLINRLRKGKYESFNLKEFETLMNNLIKI